MKIVHRVILVASLWLIFVNPGSTNLDTDNRMQMAHAWWTGTEEGIPGKKLVISVNGKNYIPYDLGQSMLMLPGDWLGTKLGQNVTDNLNESQKIREAVVSFLIFLPINVFCVVSCFNLLRLFNYSEKLAGLSSIVWLLGTSVLFYSSFHQQNNQILLFVLLGYQAALAYVKSGKKQLATLSGIAIGIAFLIRITSVIHAASILLFMVGCVTQKQKLQVSQGARTILLWLMGFIPLVFFERILTYIRYGSWMATSTSLHLQVFSKANTLTENNGIIQGESNSFFFVKLLTKIKLEGWLAPLFSPEKSILIYDPLVLPCLILSFICWKFLSPYIKWYLIAGILNFLLHTYIYSWSSNWVSTTPWASRYHVTSVHLWLIPLIPLLLQGAMLQIKKNTDWLKKLCSWVAKSAIALAILVQFASITLPNNLEVTQQHLGLGSELRIVQRINNIFYLLNGEKSNPKIAQVQEKAPWLGSHEKITWHLLPFRLENNLGTNSSFDRYISILYVLWILVFILAVASTTWMFLSYRL